MYYLIFNAIYTLCYFAQFEQTNTTTITIPSSNGIHGSLGRGGGIWYVLSEEILLGFCLQNNPMLTKMKTYGIHVCGLRLLNFPNKCEWDMRHQTPQIVSMHSVSVNIDMECAIGK